VRRSSWNRTRTTRTSCSVLATMVDYWSGIWLAVKSSNLSSISSKARAMVPSLTPSGTRPAPQSPPPTHTVIYPYMASVTALSFCSSCSHTNHNTTDLRLFVKHYRRFSLFSYQLSISAFRNVISETCLSIRHPIGTEHS